MTPDEAYEEALSRIEAARDSGAETLDLGDLPLAELPDELAELTNLQILAIGGLKLIVRQGDFDAEWDLDRPTKVFPSFGPLSSLKALTWLNVNDCDQVTSLEPLGHLTALTWLNVCGCIKVTSLEPLGHLTALTSLDLSPCPSECAGLRRGKIHEKLEILCFSAVSDE